MSDRLDANRFEDHFHPSWWGKMKPFFETEDAWNIYQYLKVRGQKIDILPKSGDVYKAFRWCGLDNLKVVIVGMEPYSTFKESIPVADGLAFSNLYTGEKHGMQPSLEYFWKGLKNDLGTKRAEPQHDLTFLSFQGVLLTNASLTVERNRIESHLTLDSDKFKTKNLWAAFQKHVFEEVLFGTTGVVYILMGKHAQSVERYINPLGNYILKTVHPSFAARSRDDEWEADNVFSKTNTILKANNNEEIYWTYESYLEKGLPF